MDRASPRAGSVPRLTLCGSLSLHPVSLGAAMHMAGYAALGLPFVYVPFEVRDLDGAIRGVRALGVRGVGVSMPFKLDVVPLLDRLSPLAARIGAVNTVLNEGGELSGHNTDCDGATRALEESGPVRGARVLLLGAGGAARAVAFGLADRGARLSIANRSRPRAEALAAEVGAGVLSWEDLGRAGAFEVVVNATSLGMDAVSRESPLPDEAISPGSRVMDIVYKPIETELLRRAAARGARTIHGGRMLLHQAAAQFELYTGSPAPLAAMEAGLEAAMAAG